MKKVFSVISILIFLFLISCKEKTEEIEKNFVIDSLKQIDMSLDYQWVVIIPGAGCHGCIQEGELFMKRNITNKKILYILTKTSSIKILQQKIGIRLNEHSNVYLDTIKQFDIPTDNAIYPCVVEMKNGKVVTLSFQSPRNNAFIKIK